MQNKSNYWLDLCNDDLLTAKALLASNRFLHMGFFCHMVVEKALKAVIANVAAEFPPRIHDLPKLANSAGIWDMLTHEQKGLMKKLIPLQIEARYPEYKERIEETLTEVYCTQLLGETEGFLCWIKTRLEK